MIDNRKKILTPIIPVESVVKAQHKQIMLTPAQTMQIHAVMKKNPGGRVTLVFGPDGQLQDMA